jgi:hypothetical protein
MTVITSGTGFPYRAKVGSDLRLAVDAITETIEEKAITDGDGYNIATSRITVTNTTENALLFLQNNENQDLIITSVFVNTSNSQGTLVGAQPELKIYRNPEAGDLATTPTVITPFNSNYGSNKTLDALIYEGAEGESLGDFDDIIDVPLSSRAALPLVEFTRTIILPRGSTYGLTYKPETGSTSVDIIVGITAIKLPVEFA